jgi:predicted nuclease of predicted toxin-antitoxin system
LSIRFQADADLNFDIVKAVKKQEPAVDFASAAGLRGVSDPEILERAAVANRVLVSHDRRTMLNHFRNRLTAGKSSPGLLIVSQAAAIRPVVESIIILWSAADPAELRDQAFHLPPLVRHVFPR